MQDPAVYDHNDPSISLIIHQTSLVIAVTANTNYEGGERSLFPHPACSVCSNATTTQMGTTLVAAAADVPILEGSSSIATLLLAPQIATCAVVEQRARLGEFSPSTCAVLYEQLAAQCCAPGDDEEHATSGGTIGSSAVEEDGMCVCVPSVCLVSASCVHSHTSKCVCTQSTKLTRTKQSVVTQQA